MKRALGEAVVLAEAEVDDRMKRPLGVAAAAEAEVDVRMNRALRDVAAAEAEVDVRMNRAFARCGGGGDWRGRAQRL